MQVTAYRYVPTRAMSMLQHIGMRIAPSVCRVGTGTCALGWLAPSCEQHSTFECNFSRRAHIDEANVQLLKKRSTSSPLFLSPPFCVSACFFWWSDSEYYYYVTTWKYVEYTLVLYRLCYIKWTVSSNTTASSCSDTAPVLLPSSRFEMCSSFKKYPQSSTRQAPPRPRLKLPRPACHHRL